MIVDIAGTRIDWATIGEWCPRVMDEGGKLRASSEHYARLRDLYRSLTIERVRRSTDRPGIERAARMFDLGRHNPVPAHHGLASELSRAEMGTLLVELRNRHRALASGHAFMPRPKGPRLDPAMLTDEALERLIKSHPDLTLVDRLRPERELRAA
jgi:hypothetical protein